MIALKFSLLAQRCGQNSCHLPNLICMRLIFQVLFVLAIVQVAGCTKDTSVGVIGKWELRQYSNGWGGFTRYQPGNGNIIELTKDVFTQYTPGQGKQSYKYQIRKLKSYVSDKIIDKLVPDGDTGFSSGISFDTRYLTLFVDAFDGPSSTYERIGK